MGMVVPRAFAWNQTAKKWSEQNKTKKWNGEKEDKKVRQRRQRIDETHKFCERSQTKTNDEKRPTTQTTRH